MFPLNSASVKRQALSALEPAATSPMSNPVIQTLQQKKKGKGALSATSPHSANTSSVPDSSAARSNDRYEMVRDGLSQGFGAIKDVSEVTEILAPLKAACALMVRGLEMTKNINDNKKAWSGFNSKLQAQLNFLEEQMTKIKAGGRATIPSLPALEHYQEEVMVIVKDASEAVSYSDSGFSRLLRRVARHRIDPLQINGWTASLDDAYKRFTSSLLLVMIDRVEFGNQYMRVTYEEANNLVKSSPPLRHVTTPQDDPLNNSIYGLDLSNCHPGTQIDTLDHIRRWRDDSSSTKQILWLSGDKGTGKTTVSATMSREWGDKGFLGGRFFFSQDSRATSTTQGFCLAIAKDLAAHFSVLQSSIQAVIRDRRILEHCGLEQQFRKMIIEPLEQHGEPVIFVVDGLDSVSDDIMRDQLVACLLKEIPRVPKLKLLFSSRALVDIEDSLGKSDLVERFDVHLPDTSDGTIHPDVSIYIENNLEDFREDEKTTVATLSRGHFLWLSSAVIMLKESRQREELIHQMRENPHHVDGLYQTVLSDAVHPMWPDELRMNVIRIIVCAHEPVSLITLCSLLRIPSKEKSTVEILLRVLGGILKSGDANLPIRIRHAEVRDFCLDPVRSKEFHVDSVVSNGFLALACLEFLAPHLRYNIRRIKIPGAIPWNDEKIKSDEDSRVILNSTVAYASSYWPFHVARALGNSEVYLAVVKFLREQLLCWTELMSWRGSIEISIEGLSCMQVALKFNKAPSVEDSELGSLIDQALSFMQQNRQIIEQSAMQVYCSALGFAVDDSLLQHYQQVYEGKCPRIVVAHRSEMPIRGFSHLFEISPDGLLVVTVASDLTIELWLSSTGMPYKWRFSGHQAEVTSLAFSLDGQLLVSGSMDGQIRIWNLVSGIQAHFMENIGQVTQVKFSPDGSSLLSISRDIGGRHQHVLRVWNLAAAPETQEPSVRFKCGEPFTMATFSSDSRRIAAATEEGLFEVRNASNGSLVSRGLAATQSSIIVLSSDGGRLGISNNAEIQLWDVADQPVKVADVATSTGGNKHNLYISHNGEYLIHGSSVWRIRTLPPSVWSGLRLPQCLERYLKGPESILSYSGGWIYCAHPQGPLVAVPPHYGIDLYTPWRTNGSKIVFATEGGALVVVDCSPLIS